MELWEDLLQSCSSSQDLRFYGKVLKTAERVFKQDLAPFEIEWMIETLLFKPVSLLETISSKRNDVAWWKTIGDAFKVLTELVSGYWNYVDCYYEDIMELCRLSYDAQTRKHAILCVIAMLRLAPTMYGDVTRHINALEKATNCKAQLALLVGTICEYHDGEVGEEIQRIWRIYLNMLGSNKNTVTILIAVLQGILGLFKHFGNELPLDQLNSFYKGLTKEYLQKPRCEQVVFSILKHHGGLFKERLAADQVLRSDIWEKIEQTKDKDAGSALKSIYHVMFTVMDRSGIQSTINNEVLPKANSKNTILKYTALHILNTVSTQYSLTYALQRNTECLEFEMRAGDVSYETAEAISWCIESNMGDSDRLLQAAILFRDNLPATKQSDILVNGILNAPCDVRRAVVTFLINQSSQDESSVEKYLPLWTDLLRSVEAADDRSDLVFEDAVSYLIDRFTEISQDLEMPSNLPSLLYLTSHILCLQTTFAAQAACAVLLPIVQLLARCCSSCSAPLLAVFRATMQHLPATNLSFDHIININNCDNEESLWETCQILIQAPEGVGTVEDTLQALKIVFSRNDVEPKLLSQALMKFENILKKIDGTDNQQVVYIKNRIRKMRPLQDASCKEARILHREIIMFLGKYVNDEYIEKCTEDTSILKMKDLLLFSLPNTSEGVKINLQGLYELVVMCEQPEALLALLSLIITNWDTVMSRASVERTAAAHALVVRVSHALCRAGRSARHALLMCRSVSAVLDITACICGEMSPGVREMLCHHLEELVLTEPVSSDGSLLAALAEQAVAMITSSIATTVRAGLDVTRSLITTLKGHNDLTKEYLPKILNITLQIHTYQSYNVYKLATEAFTEDLGLFDADALNKMVEESIKTLLTTTINDLFVFKQMLKANFHFLQTIHDFDRVLHFILVNFDSTVNGMLLLTSLKDVFQLNSDVCRKILSHENCVVLNCVFSVSLFGDLTKYVAVCDFLKEYSVVLLELEYQKTLQLIADLILSMKPITIIQLNRTISMCLSTFKTVLRTLPTILINAFEEWYRRLNIADMNLKKILHHPEQADKIQSVKILNDIFNLSFHETKKWTESTLQLYKNKYFRGLQLKSTVLFDILSVAAHTLTPPDIRSIFFSDNTGIEFCRTFMNVYFDKLIEKPFVLLEADGDCCLLLLDVVECCRKRKWPVDSCGYVMELIDELWPKFEEKSSFNMKQTLVKYLFSYPEVKAVCEPARWAVGVVGSSEASALQKIRLIGLLRAGEHFRSCYLHYASCLPTRLSEMRGEHGAMLRGLVDAAAATGDTTLFDVLVTLAAGDDTNGWWDEALDSCMSELALKGDKTMYQAAYNRCWDDRTLGVCDRILVPLLRYSTPRFCEEFLSGVIGDVFTELRRWHRDSAASEAHHRRLVASIKALRILQVVFEKVPAESLESASSALQRGLGLAAARPWACLAEACKLCLELREKATCPAGADHTIKESCRLLQCAIYNCLTAAICRWRPDEKFYKYIFDAHAWANIVDKDHVYKLPLQPTWRRRSTQRHAVSIDVSAGAGSVSGSASTRLYLRTLSENPLQYDFMHHQDDQPCLQQEVRLAASELNEHECSAPLAALLAHAAALPPPHAARLACPASLAAALRSGIPHNAKWLLAQAICNTEAEMKVFSGELVPALFQLVADTGKVTGDLVLLNGLHIDVITTIINWNDSSEIADKKYLNVTIEYLIATCVHHRQWNAIFKTLLECLDKLLKLYGNGVNIPWRVFEKYFEEIPADPAHYLQIVQRVLKHHIHIPQLLPTLLAKFEAKHWRATPRLADVFGLAINACPPGLEKDGLLGKFRSVLDKIRVLNVGDYVKVLYSVQKHCNGVCDEKHFKIISDLAPKIERTKCLTILSSHMAHHRLPHQLVTDMLDTVSPCEVITNHQCPRAMDLITRGLRYMDDGLRRRAVILVAGYCDHFAADVRKAAFGVISEAFEELFPTEDFPPAKRNKTNQSKLLMISERDDPLVRCVLNSLSSGVLRRECTALSQHLHDQLITRFAECLYMTLYIPTVLNLKSDMVACATVLLDLLLNIEDKSEEDSTRSTDKSKVIAELPEYPGTSRSLSKTISRTAPNNTDTVNTDADVKMSNMDILKTLLDFAKTNPAACKTLFVDVVKGLKASCCGFDLEQTISKHLAQILSKNPNNLTPLALGTSRVFIESISNINGFKESVETLKEFTKGSEGIGITTLLHEEVMLRCGGRDMFELGMSTEETSDVEMANSEFSLKDLISTFGKLSNWDDLRVQDRRRVRSGLPIIWTSEEDFARQLELYVQARDPKTDMSWFDKMAVSVCGGSKRDDMLWLRETDNWPWRPFHVSAMIEAVSWPPSACLVPRADCLAQWAARLMIRSAHLTQTSSEPESQAASRVHQLACCAAANCRQLPEVALQCIQRNKSELLDNETLSWLEQKVLAMRSQGAERHDDGILKEALIAAEKYTPMFSDYSPPEVIIGMKKLILQLNYDLKSLPQSKLEGIIQDVITCHSDHTGWTESGTNAGVLKTFFDVALGCYDEMWTEDADNNDVIISNMADIIGHHIDYNLTNNYDLLFSIILNKLESRGGVMKEATARNLLDKLQRTINKLDSFTTEHIEKVLGSFPAGAVKDYPFTGSVMDPSESVCKQYLQLISDAAYSLWNYVEMLHKALKADDAVAWKNTFDTMKMKIFENPYAGTDYMLLTKYKNMLYPLYNYSNTGEVSRVLMEVKSELWSRPARRVLRLAQLCPALAGGGSPQQAASLHRLLAVPDHLTIIHFHQEVSVFTDSVRRPCVLSARLSNGQSCRRLRKAGEPLRADAALQRAAKLLPSFRGYTVTPLSDDCGIIEYLEDHERLLTLMLTVQNLDDGVSRPSDAQLILSPEQALYNYRQIRANTPSYILRSAIERHSACVEDFIAKKRNFTNTLASKAIISWIFGVGDRHLANILYSIQDGGVCGVDWNTLLQYGTGELPPARLTPNLLAVLDTTVLESRLQELMLWIRESRRLFLPFIRQSFRWMAEEFHEKFAYIKDTLEGKTLTYFVTRDALQNSKKTDRDGYIKLLDQVFEKYQHKDAYTVEEQVSCFLQQCTDQKILSVTRRGWQPWV